MRNGIAQFHQADELFTINTSRVSQDAASIDDGDGLVRT